MYAWDCFRETLRANWVVVANSTSFANVSISSPSPSLISSSYLSASTSLNTPEGADTSALQSPSSLQSSSALASASGSGLPTYTNGTALSTSLATSSLASVASPSPSTQSSQHTNSSTVSLFSVFNTSSSANDASFHPTTQSSRYGISSTASPSLTSGASGSANASSRNSLVQSSQYANSASSSKVYVFNASTSANQTNREPVATSLGPYLASNQSTNLVNPTAGSLSRSIPTASLKSLSAINNSSTRLSNSSTCPQVSNYWTPISIAPTGSGLAYASACSSAKISWLNAQSAFASALPVSTSVSTFGQSFFTTTATESRPAIPSGAVSTACDGFARVDSSQSAFPLTPFTVTQTETFSMHAYTQTTALCPVSAFPFSAAPSCTIQPSDCQALYGSSKPNSVSYWGPICSTSTTSVPLKCTVAASTVQLYYWPETTTGTPTCQGIDGLTWATIAPPPGKRTAVVTLSQPVAPGPAYPQNFTNGTNQVITMTSP